MTGPVKPPATPPVAPTGSSEATRATPRVVGESYADAAGRLQEPAGGPIAVEPLRQLVEELRAGRLDGPAAVDRLVARAVAQAGAVLPAAERAELEAFLRSALANDPTLQALMKDMEDRG